MLLAMVLLTLSLVMGMGGMMMRDVMRLRRGNNVVQLHRASQFSLDQCDRIQRSAGQRIHVWKQNFASVGRSTGATSSAANRLCTGHYRLRHQRNRR